MASREMAEAVFAALLTDKWRSLTEIKMQLRRHGIRIHEVDWTHLLGAWQSAGLITSRPKPIAKGKRRKLEGRYGKFNMPSADRQYKKLYNELPTDM